MSNARTCVDAAGARLVDAATAGTRASPGRERAGRLVEGGTIETRRVKMVSRGR